ncbi:hypothetical protein ACFLY8_05855 [Halobacteriota archaeon]
MTERKNSSKKKVEPKELLWIEEGYVSMAKIRNTNKTPEKQPTQKIKPVKNKSSSDKK